MTTIKIKELFSSSIPFRDAVRKLKTIVDNKTEDIVRLDFSGVESVSRSFADEFFRTFLAKDAPLQQNVTVVGMTEPVSKMMNIVKRTQNIKKHMRSFPSEKIVNVSSSADIYKAIEMLL